MLIIISPIRERLANLNMELIGFSTSHKVESHCSRRPVTISLIYRRWLGFYYIRVLHIVAKLSKVHLFVQEIFITRDAPFHNRANEL